MGRLSHILAMPGPEFEPPPLKWWKWEPRDPPRDWSLTREAEIQAGMFPIIFKDAWNFQALQHRKKHGPG